MNEILLVDGYNVINLWTDIPASRDGLDHARDRLADMLANYAAFRSRSVTLVFDAHSVRGEEKQVPLNAHLTVVYTQEGETADSYIEKAAYRLVRAQRRVFVVTSDRAEQFVALGVGAFRISSRELLAEIKDAERAINRLIEDTSAAARHEVGNRLDGHTASLLNQLRRGF